MKDPMRKLFLQSVTVPRELRFQLAMQPQICILLPIITELYLRLRFPN